MLSFAIGNMLPQSFFIFFFNPDATYLVQWLLVQPHISSSDLKLLETLHLLGNLFCFQKNLFLLIIFYIYFLDMNVMFGQTDVHFQNHKQSLRGHHSYLRRPGAPALSLSCCKILVAVTVCLMHLRKLLLNANALQFFCVQSGNCDRFYLKKKFNMASFFFFSNGKLHSTAECYNMYRVCFFVYLAYWIWMFTVLTLEV